MSETRVVARYFQHHKQHTMECSDLDEAVAFLAEGMYNNLCSPLDVVDQDGAVILDKTALGNRIAEYGD